MAFIRLKKCTIEPESQAHAGLQSNRMTAAAAGGGTASALAVVRAYQALAVPAPGEQLEFVPADDLQPVRFRRPEAMASTQRAYAHRAGVAAAEAEAAAGLRPWAVAALACALSLDNIITLLTCARPSLPFLRVGRVLLSSCMGQRHLMIASSCYLPVTARKAQTRVGFLGHPWRARLCRIVVLLLARGSATCVDL